MSNYKIVDIPVKMEKYYGSGSMLHPTLEQVSGIVEGIPEGEILTIQDLCDQLSELAGSKVTCPMRTGNAIKKLSKSAGGHEIPFWRVVRKDGFLIKLENQETWAAKLEEEGAKLSFTKSGKIRLFL